MKKLLLILSLVLSTSSFSCASPQLVKTQKELLPKKLPVVVLYSADWCWWCEKAEMFLTDNKIQYVKRDIEDPVVFKRLEEIAEKLNYKRNLGVVPLFIVGRDIVAGFDPISVMAYLEKAKWPDPHRESSD